MNHHLRINKLRENADNFSITKSRLSPNLMRITIKNFQLKMKTITLLKTTLHLTLES